ncbi:MAG: hypothetical protein ACE5G0_14510 [Rhodothermales bacterium]
MALGQPPAPSQNELDAADLNGDGLVTVQDLVLLANTIAGGNRPPVADAGASPESGLAGTAIQLDATRSFDLDGDALRYRWRQLHMDRFSTEYVTENQAVLSDSMSATPTFTPEWPGKYRFELEVADAAGLVERDTMDVLVGKDNARQLDVKGIIFGDVFGELGGPRFDVTPEDPDSLAAVQSRAMDGAVRIGAGWSGIVAAAFYERINPLPVIRPFNNDLSLTSEADYAAIVGAAHAKGLKVFHEESVAPGFSLRPGELDSLEIMRTQPQWWDRWFTEWETYLLSRAELAEKYGVEMFSLMLGVEETFRPVAFPQYGERWRDIITQVRGRYSGKIAVTLFVDVGNLNFLEALDVLVVDVALGGVIEGRVSDVKDPTLDELKGVIEEEFNVIENVASGIVPVHYILIATSDDGQIFPEPPLPPSERDFQEQVRYFEAFFQALEDEPWIQGMFSERWAWFDEMDYPGIFFDLITGDSPRSKPAEEVIKLWFGIY